MKYLLCLDGTRESEKAAISLASMAKYEDDIIVYTVYWDPTPNQHNRAVQSTLRSIEVNVFDKWRERFSQIPNIDLNKVSWIAEGLTKMKNVKIAIINFAYRNSVDSIIMGTSGQGFFKKILFKKSLSRYVVNHAQCSVFVIK